MSQRLFRPLQGAGSSVCWFCQHDRSIPRKKPSSPIKHIPSASSNGSKLLFSTASASFQEGVPVPSRSKFIKEEDGNGKDSRQDDGLARAVRASKQRELSELPVEKFSRQSRLDSPVETLCRALLGRGSIDRLRYRSNKARIKWERLQAGQTDQITSKPRSSLNLFKAQIASCPGAKDLEIIINTALPLNGDGLGEDAETFNKTAAILNSREVADAVLNCLKAHPDPQNDVNILSMLVHRLRKALSPRDINIRLKQALVIAAAAAHVPELVQTHLELVQSDTYEKHDLVPGQSRQDCTFPSGQFSELLTALRDGLRNGSAFTGVKYPGTIATLLEHLHVKDGAKRDTAAHIFSSKSLLNWRFLDALSTLLAECKSPWQLRKVWDYIRTNILEPNAHDRSIDSTKRATEIAAYFIHQFIRAGDASTAWGIADSHYRQNHSGTADKEDDGHGSEANFHSSVWNTLITHADAKPKAVCDALNATFSDVLKAQYIKELELIEKRLEVEWDPLTATHSFKSGASTAVLDEETGIPKSPSQDPEPTESATTDPAAGPLPSTTLDDLDDVQQPEAEPQVVSDDEDHLSWANLPRLIGRRRGIPEIENPRKVKRSDKIKGIVEGNVSNVIRNEAGKDMSQDNNLRRQTEVTGSP